MYRISYFQRKNIQNNGSVEIIFNNLRADINQFYNFNITILKFKSTNIVKVIYNILYCFFKQGDINHITGDIQYVALLLKKNKTILTILDCIYLENSNGFKHLIFKYLFLKIPINKSTFITTISEFSKSSILKYYPNLNPNKIYVIPVSISEKFSFKIKIFNDIEPRLLQIGTSHNKNLKNLILAIKDIKCVLVIIGKINENIFNFLKLNFIKFENYVDIDEPELIKQYESADIITFVSTYEGFGMPIIEANAIGRCVITSNCTSMPEIANNAACLVDPFSINSIKDGELKICNNQIYRQNLIDNGIINAKRFDKDKIHKQYLTLYKKINH